ncbi:hypothetical protein Bbelb_322070 [Branchiostoma belcheri]|nr:hypothetical protein Bbelb_322070 [Branchiostoma belcheri]
MAAWSHSGYGYTSQTLGMGNYRAEELVKLQETTKIDRICVHMSLNQIADSTPLLTTKPERDLEPHSDTTDPKHDSQLGQDSDTAETNSSEQMCAPRDASVSYCITLHRSADGRTQHGQKRRRLAMLSAFHTRPRVMFNPATSHEHGEQLTGGLSLRIRRACRSGKMTDRDSAVVSYRVYITSACLGHGVRRHTTTTRSQEC